jgi:hypothetical protein
VGIIGPRWQVRYGIHPDSLKILFKSQFGEKAIFSHSIFFFERSIWQLENGVATVINLQKNGKELMVVHTIAMMDVIVRRVWI